jgi:ribosomal protein L5
MKKKLSRNIFKLLSLIFILSLGKTIYAQESIQNKSTSNETLQNEPVNRLREESTQKDAVSTEDQKLEKQQEKNKKKEENTQVKQIKGSKPDMSKARRARPPYIVRPSGSGMPVGAGKPGGAIKPGRR